jgi:uncharacterized membrane protein YfcA
MLPHFTPWQWLLAVVAGFCIGFSKSGFAGAGLLTVLIMAQLFGPLESTGVLLPMLICGDIMSVRVFHQHARWPTIWRMLPPTLVGIVAAYLVMRRTPVAQFGPVIGWIVLVMAMLQGWRRWRPTAFERVPHSRGFAWMMGAWSGIATMLANAAGPVMALYFLAIDLPKFALVGTSAWFFLIVNVLKVPLSWELGLIHGGSLLFNLLIFPSIALGIYAGRNLMHRIPQKLFETLLLVFAVLVSLRLIGVI